MARQHKVDKNYDTFSKYNSPRVYSSVSMERLGTLDPWKHIDKDNYKHNDHSYRVKEKDQTANQE